jgi:hypothetical protein
LRLGIATRIGRYLLSVKRCAAREIPRDRV